MLHKQLSKVIVRHSDMVDNTYGVNRINGKSQNIKRGHIVQPRSETVQYAIASLMEAS